MNLPNAAKHSSSLVGGDLCGLSVLNGANENGEEPLVMAKPPVKEIELVPDAWPRFERFIKQVAKAGPQHKAAKKKKSTTIKTTKARTGHGNSKEKKSP
jgi:hypothetical protein